MLSTEPAVADWGGRFLPGRDQVVHVGPVVACWAVVGYRLSVCQKEGHHASLQVQKVDCYGATSPAGKPGWYGDDAVWCTAKEADSQPDHRDSVWREGRHYS